MIWKKKPDITLTWEWPDGRSSEYQLSVVVDSIVPESKSLFGLKKTPSVIGWMPDGVTLNGIIKSDDSELSGKTLKLLIPGDEVEGVSKGSLVILGVVDKNICIVASTGSN